MASGAVIFVFGLYGPERTALPGPVLIALLGTLGFSEPTSRSTILRMRRSERLTSVRRGPVVEYALSAASQALTTAVLAPVVGERPAWDGSFHGLLFSIPESSRAYRDALRRTAVLAGFGILRPGLLVTPDERRWSRLQPVLDGAPPGSRLLRVELRLSPEDARSAAAEAWPLDELVRNYRTQVEVLERAAEEYRGRPPDGPEAVRATWEIMNPLFLVATDDPGLPAALLPEDWPGEPMRRAVVDVAGALQPALSAYVTSLLHEAARPSRQLSSDDGA
jgi:phenylacetic acid degradation operon negative regulatory protein